MLGLVPVLAEASATIHYKLSRLQTLIQSGWWQWFALLLVVVGVAAYVVWMYRKDSGELPRGLAVLLCLLRLTALAGILFFFFGLEKRAERKLVKNSRVVLLVDTSQSMGLRDSAEDGSAAAGSRLEQVASNLASGPLIQRLREQHDVIAYRFDEADHPTEIASFQRKPPADAKRESDVSEADRLRGALGEARNLAQVAAGNLALSAIAGLIYLVRRSRKPAAQQGAPTAAEEASSWSLLVSVTLLIAAAIVLATARLQVTEFGWRDLVGLREPDFDALNDDDAKVEPQTPDPQIDWAANLLPRGAETRIGDTLRFILDKERGGPIAGMIVITDGGSNAGSDYKIAAEGAAAIPLPIHAVGMGSAERPSNIRVVDLEAPERIYPGDKFNITGYVQAQNYRQGGLTVELLMAAADGTDEVKLDEQTVEAGRSAQIVPVKFELKPEEQGVRQFKLRVRPFEGELDPRDNEKTAKVEIIDRRTKILLMAGGPMRDFIFLRNQLFRDKEVVSDVWLQSGKPGISQEANELLFEFPSTEDKLFEYDAIVAFDPDWEQLTLEQIQMLERWVAEKAGGLVIVTGPVFTPQWSSRRRGDERIDIVKSLYPVVFYYQGAATLSLGRFGSEKSWPLVFTREGLESEFLWLDENASASEQAWNQFEGVSGYYAVKDPKLGARVFARFGDPDTAIDNLQPIYMAGQFYGSGRVFFLASGEMWRVRAVDDAYFEQFYTKLIRWAAEGRLLRDSSRGVLLVDKDRAALGDQVAVRAILQDAQHQPLAAESVNAVLVQPDNKRLPLKLKAVKDEGRQGIYVEQFTAIREGDYRIELQHPSLADQVLTREVRIKIPARELEFPERNDALLKDLANKTGGEYFVGLGAATGSDSRSGLAGKIPSQDQVAVLPGTPDRNFERELMGWLLGLICGVLSLEWLLRRLSKLA